MSREAKEDEVGIEAVQAVPQRGIVAAGANVLHDLVLALARYLVARVHDLDRAPARVGGHLAPHEEVNARRQPTHKVRAGCDAVAVEGVIALGHRRASGTTTVGHVVVVVVVVVGVIVVVVELLLWVIGSSLRALATEATFTSRKVATLTLLVELGARCHAVDSNQQQLARLHEIEEPLNVPHHFARRLLFVERLVVTEAQPIALVDDAIGVNVEVVELGHLDTILSVAQGVIDRRVALHEPPKEPRHSHTAFGTEGQQATTTRTAERAERQRSGAFL